MPQHAQYVEFDFDILSGLWHWLGYRTELLVARTGLRHFGCEHPVNTILPGATPTPAD